MPEQSERHPRRFGRLEEHGEVIPSGPVRPLGGQPQQPGSPDPADAGVAVYDAQFPDWDAPAIQRIMTIAPFRKLPQKESDDA